MPAVINTREQFGVSLRSKNKAAILPYLLFIITINTTFSLCPPDISDECIPKPLNNEVKTLAEGLVNNNPLGDAFNPFLKSEKEDRVEEFKELDFNQFHAVNREETPTPPADAGRKHSLILPI